MDSSTCPAPLSDPPEGHLAPSPCPLQVFLRHGVPGCVPIRQTPFGQAFVLQAAGFSLAPPSVNAPGNDFQFVSFWPQGFPLHAPERCATPPKRGDFEAKLLASS